MEKKQLQAHVSGRVQGVFYRHFVQEQARSLGLVGYAENLNDGTVSVVAQGGDQDLDTFEKVLWKGSPLSEVSEVEVRRTDPDQDFTEFSTY